MKKYLLRILTVGSVVVGLLIAAVGTRTLTQMSDPVSETPDTEVMTAEEIFAAFDPADALREIPEQVEEKVADLKEQTLPAEGYGICAEEIDLESSNMYPSLPNARLDSDGSPVYRAENLN